MCRLASRLKSLHRAAAAGTTRYRTLRRLGLPDAGNQRSLESAAGQTHRATEKPKGKELSWAEHYYNRLVRSIRQPIKSLFNWIEEKTGIHRASKVRSTNALLIHCWWKLAVAFFPLVSNY